MDLKAHKLSDDEFGELINEGGNIYLTQGETKFLVGRLEPVVFNNMEAIYQHTIDKGIVIGGMPKATAEEALANGRDIKGNIVAFEAY